MSKAQELETQINRLRGQLSRLNTENEVFVHWLRTPTPGLRYCRISHWTGGDQKPNVHSLAGREVISWTLDPYGKVIRLLSVMTNQTDGCRAYVPCPLYPDEPIDPFTFKPKILGNPPSDSWSGPEVEAAEWEHRESHAIYWERFAAIEAERLMSKQEAAKQTPIVVAAPVVAPKKSLFSRLFGK